MNTRLQVEHPVTEAVTGLDLVRLQLSSPAVRPCRPRCCRRGRRSARPCHRGPPLRRGPRAGLVPGAGTLHRFEYSERHGAIAVRVDSGVESASVVSPHYDPMLAKFIAHAPTRAEAATALAASLAGTRIHGLTTNRDLLVRVLRHPGFLAGKTDTGFLDRHGVDRLAAPTGRPRCPRRHALAAALAGQARRRTGPGCSRPSLRDTATMHRPSNRRPTTSEDDRWRWATGSIATGTNSKRCRSTATNLDVDKVAVTADRVSLTIGGLTRHYLIEQVGPDAYVDGADGSSTLHERARFPGGDQFPKGRRWRPCPVA